MLIASGGTRWCHGSQPGLLDVMIEVVVGVKFLRRSGRRLPAGGDQNAPEPTGPVTLHVLV